MISTPVLISVRVPSPLRIVAGSLFVAAGMFKLLVARQQFAQLLALLDMPQPKALALAVILTEVCGGIALCSGRFVRPAAALLAVDMVAAIALVGEPGRHGHTHRFGVENVGGEPWRLPLEVALLGLTLWLALGTLSQSEGPPTPHLPTSSG